MGMESHVCSLEWWPSQWGGAHQPQAQCWEEPRGSIGQGRICSHHGTTLVSAGASHNTAAHTAVLIYESS
jgi:hypothetical protein